MKATLYRQDRRAGEETSCDRKRVGHWKLAIANAEERGGMCSRGEPRRERKKKENWEKRRTITHDI